MFFVGQKVVCINDGINDFKLPGWSYDYSEFPIKKDEIYTIRWLGESQDGQLTMKLKEVPDRREGDGGYVRERFRPLVEKKTDISLFKSMLNGSLKEKKARLNGIKEKEHA